MVDFSYKFIKKRCGFLGDFWWQGPLQTFAAYLRVLDKLQGKAVTHFRELEWWRTLMVECVTLIDYIVKKRLHIPPSKSSTIQLHKNV